MSGEPTATPEGPTGEESKGRPKNDRERTEAVLEDALPEDQQRKPRTGDGDSGEDEE